ncbi:hypothetical protein [Burkholderia cenocepacia]|uniref:hypothetical protein n=1 Tax=Burkholderia cenocepacia TaxID=95486 RepID=UPI001B924E7E|nr:hypothetical protein [Burkholderia cenocepacia]MBR8137219.1 hypothetical protein [Burkholderia cenocepacia]
MITEAKCLDPNWRYRRAVETDIRKTFQRVRRELARQHADVPQMGLFDRVEEEGSSPSDSNAAHVVAVDIT